VRATSLGHAGILIETRQATIVCDPWFVPAFFGSWFVFPRNDRLPPAVLAKLERPDFLYLSHLHGDHFDEPWLREHVDRSTTVLLPDYPTDELEERCRALGFERFVHTRHGLPAPIAEGLSATIFVETSISDGPGGDSALLVDDGESRLLNMNDCRVHDLAALTAGGPVDQQWLQYSGAIWYPMVYDMPQDEKRAAVAQKVDAQFTRATRYVEAVNARVVVPSAGPPCFLDPELFGFNVIDGDELSIFLDASVFLAHLGARGIDTGRLVVPGTVVETAPDHATVTHSRPDGEVRRTYSDKRAALAEYQADWAPWLASHRSTWHAPTHDLIERLTTWWEPLLARCPTLRAGVGANLLLRADELEILVDFPHGRVARFAGEPYAFSLDIPRPLVETVVADRAVDWSNSLLLSCRFRAWRDGEFNEYVYNFLKSLSPERIDRAEAEAVAKLAPPTHDEEIDLAGYRMERWCPHRQADLAIFGEVCDGVLTCHLHGWQFDLESGACLTASDRHLRVRRIGPA
jgi:UDP-MurNAc hydroxylase